VKIQIKVNLTSEYSKLHLFLHEILMANKFESDLRGPFKRALSCVREQCLSHARAQSWFKWQLLNCAGAACFRGAHVCMRVNYTGTDGRTQLPRVEFWYTPDWNQINVKIACARADDLWKIFLSYCPHIVYTCQYKAQRGSGTESITPLFAK
jgi:hypothetical protein